MIHFPQVSVHSLTSTGEGVGTLPDGMKIFIDGALPNEVIQTKVTEKKKNYARGQILKILTESCERQNPICPLFSTCGGCQIMHLSYSKQLILKHQRVLDAFKKIGVFSFPEINTCIPSPDVLHYRNKIQLPIQWEGDIKKMGLYQRNSHQIIPLNRCFIQCQNGEMIVSIIKTHLTLKSVRHVLIRNSVLYHEPEILITFVTNGSQTKKLKDFADYIMQLAPQIKGVVENINKQFDNTILSDSFKVLAGRPYFFERLLNKTFKIGSGAFFQVNPKQTEQLYHKAMSLANIQPHEIVLDAYCGVGTLALFAAEKAAEVYGIECISSAISNAKENAILNDHKNCTFICGKAEEIIGKLPSFATVFLNPPRKGCDVLLLHTLLKKRPKKILYISCDPATLVRDLNILTMQYKVIEIQPFDMFPQTMHIETVVLLHQMDEQAF